MTAEAVQSVWTLSLAIFAVVLIAVALLLTLVLRAAGSVHAVVEEIWIVGQKIANNTIHIALLARTNEAAGAILGSAGGVVRATAAVKQHAESCPGCPACVLGPGWSR